MNQNVFTPAAARIAAQITVPTADRTTVRGAAAIRGIQGARAARIACARNRQSAPPVRTPQHSGSAYGGGAYGGGAHGGGGAHRV
ncbi:hypothetical protein [Streptomyces sp. NPDC005423]|uniref:hypothetical protein n=1 Tax=Streptomyces sp. NPDC005423 TaxID=3155343 RepID=UPI0033B61880